MVLSDAAAALSPSENVPRAFETDGRGGGGKKKMIAIGAEFSEAAPPVALVSVAWSKRTNSELRFFFGVVVSITHALVASGLGMIRLLSFF